MSGGRWAVGLVAAVLASPLPQGLETLDAWIVVHFRHAQLLPTPADSMRASAAASANVNTAVTATPLARVESIRGGRGSDTLFALHFDDAAGPPALATGAVVRLVGTTGTTTPVTGRVAARRAFRAPTLPPRPRAGASGAGTVASAASASASAASGTPSRHGWAYLVVVPKSGSSGVPAYRGWYLQATDGAPRR